MKRKQIERAVGRLIDNAHSSLFGEFFDVKNGDGRERAIVHFADLYERITEEGKRATKGT